MRFTTIVLLMLIWDVSVGRASDEGLGIIAKNPAPSPSGTEIAVEANYSGHLNLWIASADGKSIRQLTNNAGTDEEPAWSPDGQLIVFASTRANTDVTDIWSIQPDGSHLTQLTSNSLNN